IDRPSGTLRKAPRQNPSPSSERFIAILLLEIVGRHALGRIARLPGLRAAALHALALAGLLQADRDGLLGVLDARPFLRPAPQLPRFELVHDCLHASALLLLGLHRS